MSETFDERVIHGLRVRIDRDLCVGFGDCITEAPDAFRLDEGGVAEFQRPELVSRDALMRACGACPVDAITVWDGDGHQIVP